MAIERQDCYILKCDGCGKDFDAESDEKIYYPDTSCLTCDAVSANWEKIDDKWYCLDCQCKQVAEDDDA